MADRIVKKIEFSAPGSYLGKNDLMIVDLLAHNNWKRPIYFAATAPASSYLNLAAYMQQEGLAYRLVPIKQNEQESQQETRVATDIMYDNFMNKFKWGSMDIKGTYLDKVFLSSCALNVRRSAGTLAAALVDEKKKDKAIKVLDKCMEVAPLENVPIDATLYSMDLAYYQAGANDKANALSRKLFDNYESDINYYYALDRKQLSSYGTELRQAQGIMEQLVSFAKYFKQDALQKEYEQRYGVLMSKYGITPSSQQRQ
jgi:hypothetical protein